MAQGRGVCTSQADRSGKAAPPQLRDSDWRQVLDEVFDSNTRAVLMTDAAPCFVRVDHPGIVDKHQVNHSEHEFIRSVEVIAHAETLQRRPGMAGTQMLDREWGIIKGEINLQGSDARGEEGRKALATEVRAAQFKRMCGTKDRWPEYCSAIRRMREGGGSLPQRQWPERAGSVYANAF